jgi:GTP-binding protein
MEIKSIQFIKSSPDLKSCPGPSLPEYAFAGRSNVGKSSLINMVVQQKNLAKTSSTPGKTQYINHFLINESWYLVDLPGYGYAKAAQSVRKGLPELIREYLLKRQTLACLFILIDCRHKPLENDLEFITWSGEKKIPIALCFTKTDKLSTDQLDRNMIRYREKLSEYWEELPEIFMTSSHQQNSRTDIIDFIERTNTIFAQSS